MNIIIFGAAGSTGSLLMAQAIAAGHNVTAFVRNPAAISLTHKRLNIIRGDVMEPESVKNAIAGHEAVFCTIGAPANKTGNVRSQGTSNIIRGMQRSGARRLICQASLGYGDSAGVLKQTPFIFRAFIVPFILKKAFEDHALQEEFIKESGLDWTIVRPGNLTDGPATGNYRHGFKATDKNVSVKISRADVAHFMLSQLDTDAYLYHTPGISYER